jgi:hypothetical protein
MRAAFADRAVTAERRRVATLVRCGNEEVDELGRDDAQRERPIHTDGAATRLEEGSTKSKLSADAAECRCESRDSSEGFTTPREATLDDAGRPGLHDSCRRDRATGRPQ